MVKWLEVIKLRSVGKNPGSLEELLRSMSQVKQNGLLEMQTYRHAALETDLSVHLLWESEFPEMNGSAPGLRLAQALKEFGLTDHAIWVKEEK
jgi:hypothetical protein